MSKKKIKDYHAITCIGQHVPIRIFLSESVGNKSKQIVQEFMRDLGTESQFYGDDVLVKIRNISK